MEKQHDDKIKQYFFLFIILIFAWLLFSAVAEFFSAFLIAVIFYILSEPLIKWLVKKRLWRKNWAALLVLILSFFVILLPVWLLFTLLYHKISLLLANPDSVMQGIKKINTAIEQKYHYELISNSTINDIKGKFTDMLRVLLNQGFGFISTITMMYFFLYFMLKQRSRLEAAIVFYLPFKREKIYMFGKELVAQTFSNALGIPLIAAVQGLMAFICYMITGVQQPGFWGVITAFTSVLPIVGSMIVWAPMAVYMFINGQNWQGIFILIWSAGLVSGLDYFLRLILAKRMADVHPIITVLGIVVGVKYFGFIGLIFGPVLISYFLILLKIYYLEYQKNGTAKPPPAKKRPTPPLYIQPFMGTRPFKNKTNPRAIH